MPKKKSNRKAHREPLAEGKRWPFRLAALLLIPLLTIGALEGILRLAGYGYPAEFWQKDQIGGKDFFVNNEEFSLRFFPSQLARWAHPVRILAQKPAGTFRIFIMGESAAQGDPEPAYSASRYLEALLRERYPTLDIEVANVAFTAINSHVILPIARDCARRQGDVWIVYMGNNEMIGPFGAATVFGMQAPPLALVRADLALQRLRLGQWITDAARKLRRGDAASAWGGMEMFLGNQLPPSDPRKKVVYRNFEANLRDIVQAGLDSGAKVLLNTVAVNLEDCPPFASSSDTQQPPGDRAAGDQLCAKAANAQSQAHFAEAAQELEQAANLDASRADLQFRWAQCLEQLTNSDAAVHFQNACDCDALPFRADSTINQIIREAVKGQAGSNLVLCDAAEAFARNQAMSSSLFYEHVHLNFEGNYRLGRLWAAGVEPFLPPQIRERPSGDWALQATCERRLGLTDLYRRAILEMVIARLHQPPLSSQINNGQRLNGLEAQVKELRQRAGPDAQSEARGICAQATQRAPDDYILHEIFASVLQAMGDFKASALQWHEARQLMPRDRFAFLAEGQMLERQGHLAEARDACRQAANLYPNWADPWLELGKMDSSENKGETALENYKRALRLDPGNARTYYYMGKTFSHMRRASEAADALRHAVQIKPDFVEAHFALGTELGALGRIPEARSQFEETVRLQPNYALAHLDLGVSLMKMNELDAARREFIETLRLEPDNKFARDYLAQVQRSVVVP